MVTRSVVTVIRHRNSDADHLPLDPRQLRAPEHQLPVQRQMGEHHPRLNPVNRQDVRHAPPSAGDCVVRLGQLAVRVVSFDGPNERHDRNSTVKAVR